MVVTNVVKDIKLLLTGIQGAGKTSILKVLDQDFIHLHHLKPTLGVERTMASILGLNFVRWDLGGQEKYRERYLEDLEKYFGNMNLLVYVIDIQEDNEQRIQDTLTFFETILKFIEEKSYNPDFIAVLFHKFDPDIITNELMNTRMKELIGRINSFRSSNQELWFYPTSIFDRATLVTVFSHVILQVYPRREIIETELKKIREFLETPILCITDSTPFILGKVGESGISDKDERQFTNSLISNVSLLRTKEQQPEFHMDLFNPQVSFLMVPIQVKHDWYYLAGLWDRHLFLHEDEVVAFKDKLQANTMKIQKVLELFYG